MDCDGKCECECDNFGSVSVVVHVIGDITQDLPRELTHKSCWSHCSRPFANLDAKGLLTSGRQAAPEST
jgi:hypothetical protein